VIEAAKQDWEKGMSPGLSADFRAGTSGFLPREKEVGR